MNIKSEEAHDLARRLAAETGESLTEAVTTAVRERLERVRQRSTGAPDRARAMVELGRLTAPALKGVPDPGDLLYDEHGLPR